MIALRHPFIDFKSCCNISLHLLVKELYGCSSAVFAQTRLTLSPGKKLQPAFLHQLWLLIIPQLLLKCISASSLFKPWKSVTSPSFVIAATTSSFGALGLPTASHARTFSHFAPMSQHLTKSVNWWSTTDVGAQPHGSCQPEFCYCARQRN